MVHEKTAQERTFGHSGALRQHLAASSHAWAWR